MLDVDIGSSRRWEPRNVTLLVCIGAGLAACALVGVAWATGIRRLSHALVHPHWSWLGAAMAGELVAYAGYTAAYREVARAEDGAELEVPKVAALVAAGFGVFVHGGGFALDQSALRRAGLSAREARRRVLGLGTLEYMVLAPATFVAALAVFLGSRPISPGLTLPWIVGVPAGAALAATALCFERRITGWRRVGRRLGHALHSLRLVLGLVRSPREHWPAVCGTVVYWSGEIFCLWATLQVFWAHTPPLAQLVVGYSTGYALTRRALPLGGAGIVETLMPFALGWVGIRIVPALLAVFTYRLINLWLPLVPALVSLPTLRRLERT
jgi:uncharacterized membrane protein YbhN (UPF0104 family)